jgi:allantoinase
MPLNGNPPTVTVSAFRDKQQLAKNQSYVDYALWGGLIPGNLDQIEGMAELGAIGFKACMPSAGSEFPNVDDVTLFRGMQKIAECNRVLALHAESEVFVRTLRDEMIREGRLDARSYAESRPVIAEMEAVNKALLFAKVSGCSVHFVHISSSKTIELITRAKQDSFDVTVKRARITCFSTKPISKGLEQRPSVRLRCGTNRSAKRGHHGRGRCGFCNDRFE